MQKIWGTEMCITMRVIGNYCSKSDSKELVWSFALLVDEAIWKAIDCQQGEAKRSYRGFATVMIIIVLLLVLFERIVFFILVFVLSVIAFHVIIY